MAPVSHEAVAPCERGGRVDRPVNRLPRALDPEGVCNGHNRPQQRLAGDARPILAFAADQLPLHYRDAESGGAGPLGKDHADWTRAEHHDIVDLFCWGSICCFAHSHSYARFQEGTPPGSSCAGTETPWALNAFASHCYATDHG